MGPLGRFFSACGRLKRGYLYAAPHCAQRSQDVLGRSQKMTDSHELSVGIIGCGLIGQKRAQNLAGARLVAAADLDVLRAEKLAQSTKGAFAYPDWQALIERAPVDIVIVATTH